MTAPTTASMSSHPWVIVTGGAGYIGAHTCLVLLTAGYDVAVLDNFSRARPYLLDRLAQAFPKRLWWQATDLRNPFTLHHTIHQWITQRANPPVALLHFAALKSVGESTRKPLLYHENNIQGTLTLLQVLDVLHIRTFVFSSTCAVYGRVETMPVREDTPWTLPESPYATSKQACELMLRDLALHQGWRVVSLRYFNPAGADPACRIGEPLWHVPENLFPRLWLTARGYLRRFTVYGNQYPTRDGTPVRDYIHIIDLAEAHVAALQWICSQPEGTWLPLNLGSGTGFTVLEVLQAVERVTGKTIPYEIGAPRPGDLPAIYADYQRAAQTLGWKPRRSLDDMIRDAFAWFDTMTRDPVWQPLIQQIIQEIQHQ